MPHADQDTRNSNTGVVTPGVSIAVDWVGLTFAGLSEVEVADVIGLPDGWEALPFGRWGYAHGMRRGSISIFWGGHVERMGVHVECSGEGCREWEREGGGVSWEQRLGTLLQAGAQVSRLDLAADEEAGLIDLPEVRAAVHAGHFRGAFRKGQSVSGWVKTKEGVLNEETGAIEAGGPVVREGLTEYFGSSKSELRVRIYDKAAEQGLGEEVHRTRVEVQARNKLAHALAGAIVALGAGEAFAGVLKDRLLFVEPSATRVERCKVSGWWQAFLGAVEPLKLSTGRAVTTMERKAAWAMAYASRIVAGCVEVWGADFLARLLRRGRACWPLSFASLVREAREGAELAWWGQREEDFLRHVLFAMEGAS